VNGLQAGRGGATPPAPWKIHHHLPL